MDVTPVHGLQEQQMPSKSPSTFCLPSWGSSEWPLAAEAGINLGSHPSYSQELLLASSTGLGVLL